MEQKDYNIKKTADLLGIKVRTVRQWIRDGKLNAIKYPASNRWMIPREEIERLMGNEQEKI